MTSPLASRISSGASSVTESLRRLCAGTTAATEATCSSSEVGPVSVTSAGTGETRLRLKPSAISICEVSAVTGRTFSLTSSNTTVMFVGFSTVRSMLKLS